MRANIYKTPKAYKPRRLVNGFCIAAKEGSGESLICLPCATKWGVEFALRIGMPVRANACFYGAIPVTYDGKVRCSRCNEFLKPVA